MITSCNHICEHVEQFKIDEDRYFGKCSICQKEGTTIKVYRRTSLYFETGLKENHFLEIQFFDNRESDKKVEYKYFILNSGIPIQPISLKNDVVIIVDSDLTLKTKEFKLRHDPYKGCVYVQSHVKLEKRINDRI